MPLFKAPNFCRPLLLALFLLGLGAFSAPQVQAQDAFREVNKLYLDKSYNPVLATLSDQELAGLYVLWSIPGYFDANEISHLPWSSAVRASVFARSYYEGQKDILDHAMHRLDVAAAQPFPARGTILNKLVVVTHQDSVLQEATLQLLKSSEYLTIPSLFLVDPLFPLEYPLNGWRPAYFQISLDGELLRPIVAREVIFMGGHSSLCLKQTVADVLLEAEYLQIPEITIRFVTKLIYETDRPKLEHIVRSKRTIHEQDFFRNVEGNVLRKSKELNRIESVKDSFRSTPQAFYGDFKLTNSNTRVHVIVEK